MAKPRQWTAAQDARLQTLHDEGYTAQGAAEQMSTADDTFTRHQVLRRCAELGIKPHGRRYGPGAHLPPADVERMRTCYSSGMSARQIADDFGCGREVVRLMVARGLLVRGQAAVPVDLQRVRDNAGPKIHPVKPPRAFAPPEPPMSELWRLWERADARLRSATA